MKLKDITPAEFVCHTASCCPAVFETDAGTYVIIGKKADLKGLNVGADEYAIEVKKGMIDGIR